MIQKIKLKIDHSLIPMIQNLYTQYIPMPLNNLNLLCANLFYNNPVSQYWVVLDISNFISTYIIFDKIFLAMVHSICWNLKKILFNISHLWHKRTKMDFTFLLISDNHGNINIKLNEKNVYPNFLSFKVQSKELEMY